MAGDWIKVEITTPDKPEVIQMAEALNIDQDSVTGKLVRVWIWADQNSLDGNALSVTDSFLNRFTNCVGFAAAMRQVGWLHSEDGKLHLPNFDRHNGQTAKSRALTKKRVETHRNPLKRNGNVASVTKSLPEKRREENNKNIAPRARNQHFDALAESCGLNPLALTGTEGGRVGKALADIRKACPDVTPEEIRRRAAKYPKVMPKGSTITVTALSANWTLCGGPAKTPSLAGWEGDEWKKSL